MVKMSVFQSGKERIRKFEREKAFICFLASSVDVHLLRILMKKRDWQLMKRVLFNVCSFFSVI
jgi:hypothetical protein